MSTHEPTSHCERCDDNGYVIGTSGAFAVARRCDCQTVCSLCRGTGMRLVETPRTPYVTPCSCRALDQRILLFNQATIPARFAGSTIDDYRDNDATQKKAKYELLRYRDEAARGDSGFLLWGRPGVGKTHLLCSLLSYLTLERGFSCRYVDFMQLIFDLKQGFSEGRFESQTVQPLLDVDVLLIDELGKGRNTEWELAVLDELVSARYNARKTIHATSNYIPATVPGGQLSPIMEGGVRIPNALDERLGERIFSRLHEMCRMTEIKGEDFRVGANSPMKKLKRGTRSSK